MPMVTKLASVVIQKLGANINKVARPLSHSLVKPREKLNILYLHLRTPMVTKLGQVN